jgi:hypothetical protein
VKRLGKVKLEWSPDFAYAIGVIATDGNLSTDGRHLNVTSKDWEIVSAVKDILCLSNRIGRKARGGSKEKNYYVLQFGDRNFFEFLLTIGITPAKSRTLNAVSVPSEFFVDFLRGCIDGDGNIGAFTHKESRHPQIRLRLASASRSFLLHMLHSIHSIFHVDGGHIYTDPKKAVSMLSFGKEDSMKLLRLMYYKKSLPCLTRKRTIAEGFLEGE